MTRSSIEPVEPPLSAKAGAPAQARQTRFWLGLICFVAGAAVMVVEISANRLLAPNFGNSLYTWTALIGIILIAFSVGGYLGGVLADKLGRLDLLGWLLGGAAALTMLIPSLNALLVTSLVNAGLIAGPVIISIFLFALPGILLGAVAPATIRFYSQAGADHRVGLAAGLVSMLGSLGSFVGTFLSGFLLLSVCGLKSIFLGTGALLSVMSFLSFWLARKPAHSTWPVSVMILLGAILGGLATPKCDPATIFRQLSFYHQIDVQESRVSGETMRYLLLDSTTEGGMTIPKGYLLMPYQRYWQLALLNGDLKLKRALFIGGGAFGMPEHAATLGADVDVVEIDPAVIAVGRRFFKLDGFSNVHAHADDARRFLRQSGLQYDLVFGDAYNGVRHIPAHLVTREFFTQVRSKLSADGVFIMNIISAVEGRQAVLLGHLAATLHEVFPTVELFALGTDRQESQNVILLASMKSWKPWLVDRSYAAESWQGQLVASRITLPPAPKPYPVFTDDWNPIDIVVARQLLQ